MASNKNIKGEGETKIERSTTTSTETTSSSTSQQQEFQKEQQRQKKIGQEDFRNQQVSN